MHPGGEKLIEQYAGVDATEDFYSLHTKSVLQKYQRLKIGRLEGVKDTLSAGAALSPVPFVEPPAFVGTASPYYNESHFRLQKATREFVMEHIAPVAHAVPSPPVHCQQPSLL